MQIESVMTCKVRFCRKDDSLEEAARVMWDADCGCLPVVDHCGELVGVITDRDICMAAYRRGEPLRQLRVADAMTKTVIICRAEDSTQHAERLMSTHRVRRLPVVGGRGELVGMLSRTDIARGTHRDEPPHASPPAGAGEPRH